MRILVLNCGSATLKYKLFERDKESLSAVSGRTVELDSGYGKTIARILAELPGRPDLVAHRVVHGGERFGTAAVIDAQVEAEIEALAPLAPLHNPPALEGIREAKRLGVPMVAVFDTGFHRTIPEHAYRYALPRTLPSEIRRYGFHGLSHRYVLERYSALTGNPSPTLITLHLGNGCSAAAIKNGRCVETSMGFSPLEGLVMGSRGGDVDPAVMIHLLRTGTSLDEVEDLLQKRSGLVGMAGTGDMRTLLDRSDPEARLAIEIYCHRILKYLGAYVSVLEGIEAIIFTGGIGQNAPEIRRRVLSKMEWLGVRLDEQRNVSGAEKITADGSHPSAYAIRTDEELMMAREALASLGET